MVLHRISIRGEADDLVCLNIPCRIPGWDVAEGKVEKTKAVAQAQVAEAKSRATIAEKKATGDIDWEQAAIENTATSWKDEFALVVR